MLIIRSYGKPCSLEDCPPGAFLSKGQLCFKSEYGRACPGGSSERLLEVFNSAGEYFYGEGLVQPVEMVKIDVVTALSAVKS